MPTFTPVDHDPFADASASSGPTLTPVDHDPFASPLDSAANAAASGFASGVPIVGPAFNGMLDRGVAGIGSLVSGKPYGDVLARVQAQEAADNAAHPVANKVAGVAGAVAGTIPAIAAAPAAFGAEGGALTAGMLARGALSGGAIGGADAAVRGNDPVVGAMLGAAGGAAGPVLGATLSRAPAQLAAPTADALRDAGGAGYDAARDLGVHYTGDAVGTMAQGVQQGLHGDGILPVLAPRTHEILGQLASPPAGATVPFGALEAARRAFGYAAKSPEPTERLAASRAIDGIDDLVTRGDPGDVAMATGADPAAAAAQAAQLVTEARANYAAGSRADQLGGVGEAAETRAAAANSGQNIGNATRQRVASLLLNRGGAGVRGFSDGEVEALERLVKGTPTQNILRSASGALGGGGGGHAGVAALLGSTLFGHAGAGLPIVGGIARHLSNNMTTGTLDKIIASTARRSPLYAQMAAAASPQAAVNLAPTASGAAIPLFQQMMMAAQPQYQPSP